MTWTAYAFQGPLDRVTQALNDLRNNPQGAGFIRPSEGPPLPPAVLIPNHGLFGYALPPWVPPLAPPPECFAVDASLVLGVIGSTPSGSVDISDVNGLSAALAGRALTGLATISGLAVSGPGRLLGRATASAGAVEELLLGAGLSLSGNELVAGGDPRPNRLWVSPLGDDSNDGRTQETAKLTIKSAVESAPSGTTVFVETGDYTEANPIRFPANVSLVGDNLRRVIVRPANPTLDIFHLRSGCYVTGVVYRDHKAPSFACAFPCATAKAVVESDGTISGLTLLYSPDGYVAAPDVWIEPPVSGGTQATATATITNGVITGFTVTGAGAGYDPDDPPWVSIPDSDPPVIVSSPYVQNCSSITGPFDTLGNGFTPAQLVPPFDEQDVAGTGRAINPRGAGGGIRVDGEVVASNSPLNSFVADAFTQINQGGPGHLLINKGYAQFVSCFTTFCHTGYEARTGAFANISNSVLDFGTFGLRARGYYPIPQATGTVDANIRSTVASVTVNDGGSGYSSAPTVAFSGGGGSGAAATATVDNGEVVGIVITNPGSDYTGVPTVSFSGGGGTGALATAVLNSPGTVVVDGLSRRPDVGTTVAKIGTVFYTISGATPLSSGSSTLSVFPGIVSADAGDPVEIFDVSLLTSGSLVTEYVGSGVTFNALPKFGGIANPTNVVTTDAPGRVYYAVLTETGNFSIGPFFSVEQSTGAVTINSDLFSLAGLAAIGPFKRNGVAVGVQLQEVSNDTGLLASTGNADANTAPTQFAVKTYVDGRKLRDLSDVTAPSPSDGEVVGWSTANNRWEPVVRAVLGANTFSGEQNLADNLLTRPYIKDYAEVVTAPTISTGTLVLDLENGNVFDVALNANITTLTISNPPTSGRAGSFTLVLTADGTPRSVTWGAAVKWPDGAAPTLTSTNGKKDVIVMTTFNAGTDWLAVVAGQNF
jgi:hypothetical protein